ncbi:hypothetical protein QE152_g21647 [Popillia japonica]|uniref:Uncharacterized protein n=1 Tax=Popillia japonica TaxID=7064 RepID=A0AAW1KNM4_POPJA
MESVVRLMLCFQGLFYFVCSEWIEISKTSAHEVNKSLVKPGIDTNTRDSVGSREGEDEMEKNNILKQSYINKVFVDENNMENKFDQKEEATSGDNTSNYMGFIPFIENIQSSLMRHAHQGMKSKITLLQELKYNLLFNIKEKINGLWTPTSNRRAREYYDKEEESHIDFPSNEGALMTIGFLTFAVFLIKLVLKLIYALKYKNGTMVNPNATAVYVGRKKREAFNVEAAKILQLIEEYKFS